MRFVQIRDERSQVFAGFLFQLLFPGAVLSKVPLIDKVNVVLVSVADWPDDRTKTK